MNPLGLLFMGVTIGLALRTEAAAAVADKLPELAGRGKVQAQRVVKKAAKKVDAARRA